LLTNKDGKQAKDDDEKDELELHVCFGPRNFMRETGCSAYDNAQYLSSGFHRFEGKWRTRDELARTLALDEFIAMHNNAA
jgi:hypothetical protein